MNMELSELKKNEGQKIEFLYRGKYRPFILQAVQDKEPCDCEILSKECNENHLIRGLYKSNKLGKIRIDYAYPKKNKNKFRHSGFWTSRINDVRVI